MIADPCRVLVRPELAPCRKTSDIIIYGLRESLDIASLTHYLKNWNFQHYLEWMNRISWLGSATKANELNNLLSDNLNQTILTISQTSSHRARLFYLPLRVHSAALADVPAEIVTGWRKISTRITPQQETNSKLLVLPMTPYKYTFTAHTLSSSPPHR